MNGENLEPQPHDPIAAALDEDIGIGDLTSQYFVEDVTRSARIFAKEAAIAAGVDTSVEVVGSPGTELEFAL